MEEIVGVALSYLKYCSAIEEARDQFTKEMQRNLNLSSKIKISNFEFGNTKYYSLGKGNIFFGFKSIHEKQDEKVDKIKIVLNICINNAKMKTKKIKEIG